jgi:adenylate cyclase
MPTDETTYISLETDHLGPRQRRSHLVRIIVPISFVAVILAAVLLIAYYSYHSNRKAALALSNDLLNTLDQSISTEVETYLSPAVHMVELVASFVRRGTFKVSEKSEIEHLAIEVLQAYPQLAMFNIADSNGNFLMPKKMPDGSIHTKVIEWRNGQGHVTWIRRDTQGMVKGTEKSIDNSYDPRVRPWYVGAVKNRGIFWTEVYIFFTDKKPGITAAYPIQDPGGNILGVLGLDFELSHLCGFLKELQIGASGKALIVSDSGRIVAHPDTSLMMKQESGKPRPINIDELDDPALMRAFSHYRISGQGQRIFEVSGRRYISLISALSSTAGRKWSVFIVVPEDDFVGFVATNNRRSLILSLSIVAISAVLAILFSFQVLRADRNAHIVLERKHQLEAQSIAFSELTSKAMVFDPESVEGLHQLTEITAEVFGVSRAGVWHIGSGDETLVCQDVYDSERHGHTSGMELKQKNFRKFFKEVLSGLTMAVNNMADDPRTDELKDLFLNAFGVRSILIVPVLLEGRVSGIVSFEHKRVREWSAEEVIFAQAVAGIASTRFSASKIYNEKDSCIDQDYLKGPNNFEIDIKEKATPKELDRVHGSLDSGFHKEGEIPAEGVSLERSEVGEKPGASANLLNDITILYAELNANTEIAKASSVTESISLLERLTHMIDSLAKRHGISQQKMMGDIYICLSDIPSQTRNTSEIIADLALAMKREFTRLLNEVGLPVQIRFGMSSGKVIRQLDKEGRLLNLWGEAIAGASMMATYGVPGEIQVAESTYNLLKKGYLFQDRGSFYVEGQGEINTYLLYGKL